jgi:hypothetical protein
MSPGAALSTKQPIEPEHYQDFAFTDEEKGWNYIPAGFDKIEDWIEFIKQVKNARR